MAYYRLYFLRDAHIVRCLDFHADDDGEAIGRAGTHAGPAPMELWCVKRRVRDFAAAPGLKA